MTSTKHKDPTRRQRSQNEMGTSNNLFAKHTGTVRRGGQRRKEKKCKKNMKQTKNEINTSRTDKIKSLGTYARMYVKIISV